MRSLQVRLLPSALLVLALAACDDSPSGSSPVLTREEVGGRYDLCTLSFDAPGLEVVDIFATVAESDPTPQLVVGITRDEFELEYTPRNDVLPRRIPGTYTRGRDRVILNFSDEARVAGILLPDPLQLIYTTKILSAEPSIAYRVPREDYAALAGLTPEEARNLQPQIQGTLTARFAVNGCS